MHKETGINNKMVTLLVLGIVILSAVLLSTKTEKTDVVTGMGVDESADEITGDPLYGLSLADGILQDLMFDQQNTNGFTACIPEYIEEVPKGPWPEDNLGKPLPAYNELQDAATDQDSVSFVAVNPTLIRFEGSCQTVLRTFEVLGTHEGIQEGVTLSYDAIAPPKTVVCRNDPSDVCHQAGGEFVPASSVVHEALFDVNDGGFFMYNAYKQDVDPSAPTFTQTQHPDVCIDIAYIVTECSCIKPQTQDTYCWAA